MTRPPLTVHAVRNLCAALHALTDDTVRESEAVSYETVRDVLIAAGLPPAEPARPATADVEEFTAARAAWERHFEQPDQPAQPKSVVVGQKERGSSDWAYGPFTVDEAARWAAMLTDGYWHHMEWTAVRLVGWPEGGQDT